MNLPEYIQIINIFKLKLFVPLFFMMKILYFSIKIRQLLCSNLIIINEKQVVYLKTFCKYSGRVLIFVNLCALCAFVSKISLYTEIDTKPLSTQSNTKNFYFM